MNILTPDGDKFCRLTAMSQSSTTRSTASCKTNHETYRVSGAKTNLKVGEGTDLAQSAGKIFLVVSLHILALKA